VQASERIPEPARRHQNLQPLRPPGQPPATRPIGHDAARQPEAGCRPAIPALPAGISTAPRRPISPLSRRKPQSFDRAPIQLDLDFNCQNRTAVQPAARSVQARLQPCPLLTARPARQRPSPPAEPRLPGALAGGPDRWQLPGKWDEHGQRLAGVASWWPVACGPTPLPPLTVPVSALLNWKRGSLPIHRFCVSVA